MRLTAYAGASTVLALGVVLRAFHERPNFYSASIYLAQSSACRMILLNLLLLCAGGFMFALQRILYGPLRPNELEEVWDKAFYSITETALAMTMFRDEVGIWFFLLFLSLLAGKVWQWISEGRVEILEQQPPQNPRLFHIRLFSSLFLSEGFDILMLRYCISSLIYQPRPGMMVMFSFEFAVLGISSSSTAARYMLSLYEALIIKRQTKLKLEERREERLAAREEGLARGGADDAMQGTLNEADVDVDESEIDVPGWQEKGRWILLLDLATDFLKLLVYLVFFIVLLLVHGIPIHIIRDVFITARSFLKRISDFQKYRSATKDMNERYADATAEELEGNATCIICREDMTPWQQPGAQVVNDQGMPRRRRAFLLDERLRPKKLPCGHILHFACLRSWLERQQVCPLCRSSVLSSPSSPTSPARPARNANLQDDRQPQQPQQQQQQPQQQLQHPNNQLNERNEQPIYPQNQHRHHPHHQNPQQQPQHDPGFGGQDNAPNLLGQNGVQPALPQAHSQPGQDQLRPNEVRARTFTLGPLRFTFAMGNEDQVHNTFQRLRGRRAPAGQHSARDSRPLTEQEQARAIDHRLERVIHNLNTVRDRLANMQADRPEQQGVLHAQRGFGPQQPGHAALTQPGLAATGWTNTSSHGSLRDNQNHVLPMTQAQQGILPQPIIPSVPHIAPPYHLQQPQIWSQQTFSSSDRQQTLEAGHPDLPTGLTLPDGWTLLPLHSVGSEDAIRSGASGTAESSGFEDTDVQPSTSTNSQPVERASAESSSSTHTGADVAGISQQNNSEGASSSIQGGVHSAESVRRIGSAGASSGIPDWSRGMGVGNGPTQGPAGTLATNGAASTSLHNSGSEIPKNPNKPATGLEEQDARGKGRQLMPTVEDVPDEEDEEDEEDEDEGDEEADGDDDEADDVEEDRVDEQDGDSEDESDHEADD